MESVLPVFLFFLLFWVVVLAAPAVVFLAAPDVVFLAAPAVVFLAAPAVVFLAAPAVVFLAGLLNPFSPFFSVRVQSIPLIKPLHFFLQSVTSS